MCDSEGLGLTATVYTGSFQQMLKFSLLIIRITDLDNFQTLRKYFCQD